MVCQIASDEKFKRNLEIFQVPGPDRVCLISIVMKLGGREGKNLEKKYARRLLQADSIFSLYGSYAVSAVVCGWDFGLLLQITSVRMDSARPLHSRGEMAVGAGKNEITVEDREPGTEFTQRGDSMGEKEAVLSRV